MSEFPLIDDRQIVLENLITYTSLNGYNKSYNYLKTINSNPSEIIYVKEKNKFYKLLKEDIQDYYDKVCQSLPPNSPGFKVAKQCAIDCKHKIDFIRKLNLKNRYSVAEISYILNREHSPKYEIELKKALLFQVQALNNPNKMMETLLTCLGGIVLLYAKDVLSKESNLTNRDNDCKDKLKNYDGLFCPIIHRGNGDDITYHMKNSICHGRVYLDEQYALFKDRHKKDCNEFSIRYDALIDGYVVMMSSLLGKINKHSSIIGMTIAAINSSKRNNIDAVDGQSSLISMIEFMMLYEKFKTGSYVSGHVIEKDNYLMDAINLNYPKNTTAKDIRNNLSHDFTFEEGKIILNSNNTEIGPYEWMYASNIVRNSTYVLFFEMMLQTQRKKGR